MTSESVGVGIASFMVAVLLLTFILPVFGIWTDVHPAPSQLNESQLAAEDQRSFIVGVSVLASATLVGCVACYVHGRRQHDR